MSAEENKAIYLRFVKELRKGKRCSGPVRGEGCEELRFVGGLLVNQVLTLYTTPVIYLYLDRLRLWGERVFVRGALARPPSSPSAIEP